MFNLLLSETYNFEKAFDFGYIFSNIFSKWYFYVGLVILAFGLVLFFIVKKVPRRNNLTQTQKIVYISVLAALCAVANIFDIGISQEIQISLVATVGFIAGYIFGPNWAFAACFIGDFIGAMVNPHGPYNIIINIGTGLWGLIPGIIFTYTNWNKYIKLTVSYLICAVVISGFVNTFALWLMYGLGKSTFWAYFVTYPFKLLVIAVNFVVSLGLMSIAKAIRNYVASRRGFDITIIPEGKDNKPKEDYTDTEASTN